MMTRLRARPPETLLDEKVTSVEDLLPDADVVTLRTESARVVVRPSGTEPKLKAYLEATDGDVSDIIVALRAATARLLRIDA